MSRPSAILAGDQGDSSEFEAALGVSPGEPGGQAGGVYAFCKPVLEWPVALVLLVLLAPLVLVCAGLVRLSSRGPAFYCQTRLGRMRKPYRIIKIRTMSHECEAVGGARWSTPNDPRVTRIGRFLRDTHLDEVPQLVNVLRGEMSLIGPRPERPEIAPRIEERLPRYGERLEVRPGITGLAQLQLPPDSDIAGVRFKLAYDLYYVRHADLPLDVRIALCTVFHFVGSFAKALSDLMVRSASTAARSGLSDVELIGDEGCGVGQA